MSVATFKKQFQKELKTNPKKAAMLGLLALVAVYFWVPLAIKMVSGGKSKAGNKASAKQQEKSLANAESESGPQTTAETLLANSSSTISWEQLWEWIRKDPLTVSRPELKTQHDPFKSAEKVIEVPMAGNLTGERRPGAEEAQEVVRDLSPEGLGMKLTSTIVGGNRSVAMIDQRAYAAGERVVVYDGITPIRFRLIDVRPELVILERDKQQYALKIQQGNELTVSVEDEEGL